MSITKPQKLMLLIVVLAIALVCHFTGHREWAFWIAVGNIALAEMLREGET